MAYLLDGVKVLDTPAHAANVMLATFVATPRLPFFHLVICSLLCKDLNTTTINHSPSSTSQFQPTSREVIPANLPITELTRLY